MILNIFCYVIFSFALCVQFSRLDQYAIAKFGESFEMVPRTLSENAGLGAMEIISSLYAEHAAGNVKVGIDLEEGACKDVSIMKIWDLYVTK
jgi:T-complex protein 1 subunit theta